jgi:hypothetical protein
LWIAVAVAALLCVVMLDLRPLLDTDGGSIIIRRLASGGFAILAATIAVAVIVGISLALGGILDYPRSDILHPPETERIVEFVVSAKLLVVLLASWSIYASWRININQVSLHAVYRNRLVRAFLVLRERGEVHMRSLASTLMMISEYILCGRQSGGAGGNLFTSSMRL